MLHVHFNVHVLNNTTNLIMAGIFLIFSGICTQFLSFAYLFYMSLQNLPKLILVAALVAAVRVRVGVRVAGQGQGRRQAGCASLNHQAGTTDI